jgi:hypothetical protein
MANSQRLMEKPLSIIATGGESVKIIEQIRNKTQELIRLEKFVQAKSYPLFCSQNFAARGQ